MNRPKQSRHSKADFNVNALIPTVRLNCVQPSKLITGELFVNNVPVKFYLDSGAKANTINEETYEAIGSPELIHCREKRLLFDGSTSAFIGKGRANFRLDDEEAEQDFYLVTRGSLNLLGVETLDCFGLLDQLRQRFASINNVVPTSLHQHSVENIKSEFNDIFKDELVLCTKTLS